MTAKSKYKFSLTIIQASLFLFFHSSPTTSLTDHFAISAVFDRDLLVYGCLFKPKEFASLEEKARSTLLSGDIELAVHGAVAAGLSNLRGDTVKLRFDPGFYVDPSATVQLSGAVSTDEITVQGASDALATLTVQTSHPQYLSVGREYYLDHSRSAKVVPVHLRWAYWNDVKPNEALSVTVDTASQSVTVPVVVSYSGDGCANSELGWYSLLYFLASHYQYVILLIITCIGCVVATKFLYQNSAGGQSSSSAGIARPASSVKRLILSPVNEAAAASFNTPVSSSLNLTNAGGKPYLWSQDSSPVYGSPGGAGDTNRRSPRRLTQFSYSDQ